MIVGIIITFIPIILAILLVNICLIVKNQLFFTGVLSGARNANPAFGKVLNKAGNAIPTNYFAVTYALTNIFLTLLGSLIIAFV